MASTSHTIYVYKHLLRMAKGMPAKDRSKTVQQIKEEFRKNVAETDPYKITAMLDKANSTLGYIKIVSPKRFEAREQQGTTKIVFGEAKKQNKAMTNWTGKNMDPDSVKHHHRNLNRAGFKSNAHVKGPLF